jgi:Domain of unknown function (DUF5666)
MTNTFKRLQTHLRALMQSCNPRWMGALALAMLVVACGGSGDTTASVGSGGTGAFTVTAYSEGAITSLGSVTVNGKQYEDKLASVSDEDGPRALSDLKLGMIARVSGRVDGNGLASADKISYDSQLRGPVSLVNPRAKCFFILGQRVQISDRTMLGSTLAQGINSILAGQVLEVHGYLNPVTNNLQATLVELPKNASSTYKLSGLARRVSIANSTMQIGSETFDLTSFPVARLPTEGSFTRLTLTNAPQGTRGWSVSSLNPEYSNSTPQSQADIEGVVTYILSSTDFMLNNTFVDAASVTFSNGPVKIGDIVRAKGALINGQLIAKDVDLIVQAKPVELIGLVTNVDFATYDPTFQIGDVVVHFDLETLYVNGIITDVRNGVELKVQGMSEPSNSDVRATQITFLP